jgi:hypothetical protein
MAAENVVSNRTVIQVHEENPINVSHMEAENDVMNRTVIQAQSVKPINVKHMEEETVVQIVSIGPIQEVDL